MKKFFAMILVLALSLSLICAAAMADDAEGSGSWPTITLNRTYTHLREKEDDLTYAHQSFFGPGKQYHGAGAYRPYLATRVEAMFKVGNYVFTDMYYETVGRRCVWFQSGMLKSFRFEEAELKGVPAKVTEDFQPTFGPGTNYCKVNETKPSGLMRDVIVPGGTEINVFFEAEGWVYAEFTDSSLGLITGWFPKDKVQ